LRRWQASFIQRHARRVVCISKSVQACFPFPTDLVYNAVDLQAFPLTLAESASQARRELGIPADRSVVIAIGAVQKPKGHWLLLDALRELDASVQLILVTGGVPSDYASSARGRLKRLAGLALDNLDALLRDARRLGIEQRIHVTGFRTDLAHLLSAADVLVFPSVEPEGFGRPIIEAMAMARPVVATDIGPSAELLGPNAGVLVPPDPGTLAQALSGVLRSPEERARMGRAGRARVEQCFTLDRQVAQMSEIYRSVARSA
jgi:glycosyltransferase involved in cell wall biosynthesis